MTDTSAKKDELRRALRARRRALTSEETARAGGEIARRVLSLREVREAGTLLLYLAAFNEPDTDELIARLRSSGKRVAVPVCDADELLITPVYIDAATRLSRGAYGIREPASGTAARTEDIELAVLPGIAFDKSGARVGFGKGYYDRFLSGFRGARIGVCYDFQLLDRLPSEPHDIGMDIIVTEKRIIRTGKEDL